MYQPKVSVLTLTYNDERFIGACIESVLAQTYEHWQMVITDDGSTDATPEVVARYRDPRLVYIRQEHRGIGGNAEKYNRALQHTDGELVACLAGDDAWPPYRLEKMLPCLQDEKVVMCFGRGQWINERGEVIANLPVPGFVGEVLNRPVGSVLRHLLVHNFIPSYAALMSRRAIARMGGFPQPQGVHGVDSPTCMQLALLGEFRFIDLTLGYWRVHSRQHTGSFRVPQARADLAYAQTFYQSLDPQTQALTGWTERSLRRVLRGHLANAYFEAGRRQLAGGDRKAALASFGRALWRGTIHTRMKALVGIGCGLTSVDLEKVVRLSGRPVYR